MSLDAVLSKIDETLPDDIERLFGLLRIPSISADPAFTADIDRAADWVVTELEGLGATASKRPSTGHPMVVGHLGEGAPHLLFYGHYDVQPVDPLSLWHRDPFDPAVEDTDAGQVIRARGACDDKGQFMTFLNALRAWIAVHGKPPCRITFLIEGEEETGSKSMLPFLAEHGDELKADLALICDTGLFNDDTPAITAMLRGLLGDEFTITGPNRDLHSGFYGGAAMNPIRVLSKILASLHDDTGRVTVPGFYDGVTELSPEIAAQWDALPFDGDTYLGGIGLSAPAGERGRSVLEMIWARPTCDVVGITGGYGGEGFKTVLPSKASAKVSFRLVGRQDPVAIRESFRKMVRDMLPPDCSVDFIPHGASPASIMDTTDPAFEAARIALSEEWGKEAAFIGEGGSIPIATYFQTELGMNALLVGFGRKSDLTHSPNENYRMESFHKGARSWARILDAITRAA